MIGEASKKRENSKWRAWIKHTELWHLLSVKVILLSAAADYMSLYRLKRVCNSRQIGTTRTTKEDCISPKNIQIWHRGKYFYFFVCFCFSSRGLIFCGSAPCGSDIQGNGRWPMVVALVCWPSASKTGSWDMEHHVHHKCKWNQGTLKCS